MVQKSRKITETLTNWFSSESTQRKLSNEYRHDRVFKNICILVLRTKVASALEGLRNKWVELRERSYRPREISSIINWGSLSKQAMFSAMLCLVTRVGPGG